MLKNKLQSHHVIIIAVALFQLLITLHSGLDTWQANGFLTYPNCPDPTMRLSRVEELINGGGWYDNIIETDNYPYGHYLPWTRPFDLIIIALTKQIDLVSNFSTKLNLIFASALVSPILMFLAVIAFIWALKPLRLKPIAEIITVGSFMLHPAILMTYQFGRGDHHSLFNLWFIVLIGQTIRLLQNHEQKKRIVGLGLITVTGIWFSIEPLLYVIPTCLTLAWLWVKQIPKIERTIFQYCATVTLALVPVLFIEHPVEHLFTPEYDRVSIIHLTVFALICVASGINMWQKNHLNSPAKRLTWGGLEAVSIASIIYLLYPKIAMGPFAEMSAQAYNIIIPYIGEAQPGLDFEATFALLANFGLLAIALPYLYAKFMETKQLSATNLYILFAVFLCNILALMYDRLLPYAVTCTLIPYGMLIGERTLYDGSQKLSLKIKPVTITIISIIIFPLLYIADSHLPRFSQDTQMEKDYNSCKANGYKLIESANFLKLTGKAPQKFISEITFSPALTWWTPHYTTSAFYTRNHEGLSLMLNFFNAQNLDTAKQIATDNQIDYILICPQVKDLPMYRPTLEKIIETNPNWLTNINPEKGQTQPLLLKLDKEGDK